jgi:hypothetical protein
MSCSRFGLLAVLVFSTGCAASASAVPSSPVASAAVTASAPAGSTFPHADAQTALAAARPALRACRRNLGATPVVFDATLEFEPSGKVRRVLIAPGGPVADCVRSDLTQVEIPKFDGPNVEVQMTVTL